MSCSQPRSPLFPYTTLFRSFLKQDLFNAEAQALTERLKRNLAILNKKIDEPSRKVELESIDPLVAQLQSLLVEANEATNEHNQMVADRKSTRLNSSHVAISYAVFCLKKKKARNHNQSHK